MRNGSSSRSCRRVSALAQWVLGDGYTQTTLLLLKRYAVETMPSLFFFCSRKQAGNGLFSPFPDGHRAPQQRQKRANVTGYKIKDEHLLCQRQFRSIAPWGRLGWLQPRFHYPEKRIWLHLIFPHLLAAHAWSSKGDDPRRNRNDYMGKILNL